MDWDDLPEDLQNVLSFVAIILVLFALDFLLNIGTFFSNNPIYLYLVVGIIGIIGAKFLGLFDFLGNPRNNENNEIKLEIVDKNTTVKEIHKEIIDETEILVSSIRTKINQWKTVSPKVRGKGKERQLTLSMTGYLASSYPNITLEQRLGGNRIDAVIDDIGIEAKHRPNQNEINRLYGQVDDYLRYLNHIVVVFFDTNQSMVNNFSRKINTGNYHTKVTLVTV